MLHSQLIRISFMVTALFVLPDLLAQNSELIASTEKDTSKEIVETIQPLSAMEATHIMTDALAAHLHTALEYPELARERHIEGRVLLRITLDEQGKVSASEVYSSAHTLLDLAAQEAMIEFIGLGDYRGHRQIIIPVDFSIQ